MKKIILITTILLISLLSFAQDATAILKNAYSKCQSVQNGQYEMTKFMKYMSRKDTSVSSFICSFKKLKNDSLFSSAFHYKAFYEGQYSCDIMYTGSDLVTKWPNDSTATIISKQQWAEEIKSMSSNYTFYSPLTNRKSRPIPHDSDFIDNTRSLKFIGVEKVNDLWCYHVQADDFPENDSTELMKTLRIEYHYWINKADSIPVQYSIAFDCAINNDTMYQYEKFVLNKYDVNNLNEETLLKLTSVPSYYKLKDYVPDRVPESLPKDTLAPNWTLPSVHDEEISLNNLKGHLVLIDFFYMACYPCMKALPGLQALHKKYKDKGLMVIGIDPYDKKKADVATFLSKRDITYTVVLGGKDEEKNYHVYCYPTMFLIDKKGKIIFIQIGYGNGVEDTLEKMIIQNL